MTKNVAIIGAGASGLVAAKECRQAGLTPFVFEKQGQPGGVWHGETGKIWLGMAANLSHFHMGFSDYPMTQSQGDFPKGSDVMRYLNAYVAHFQLGPHLYCGHGIASISHDMRTRRWELQTENQSRMVFDHLIVANGIFSQPVYPADITRRDFHGTVSHSGDYRRDALADREEILVIGGSFSAYEIAADLATNGHRIQHIFRNPGIVIGRHDKNGRPFDLGAYTYPIPTNGPGETPRERIVRLQKSYGSAGKIHPALYVDPDTDRSVAAIISDTYLDGVASGRITPYCSASYEIVKTGCRLEQGQHVKADHIIFCTGYKSDLPFHDSSITHDLDYRPNDPFQPLILNKGVFHPAYPTLGFTGLYRGPFFGVMEMQARWIAGVFSGRIPFPDPAHHAKGLAEERRIRAQNPRPAFPRPNYVGFMLELAREIGAEPRGLLQAAAEGEKIPMLPADFRFEGENAQPDIAQNQRRRLLERLAP